ncbi:uncharacterized protein A1O5_02371 [Cladophialophora psammophila CBS 110553]|uniref:Uncharacterized protein n=1 Tax=Cladophialophora psammophila CBS 110553 TaxID=1182543 RepID=W9X0S4_9EURO|nr:uncharacterized protein A1O5_02371 [Cladophialophora psammophila CBS 110553]EXJ74077.1 hypothetical protein A1O5_02371 [Cladophialophora psammophila CBS 110553]
MGGHQIHRPATYTEYVQRLVEGGYPNLAPLFSFLTSSYHQNDVFVRYIDIRTDGESNKAHSVPRHKVRKQIYEPVPAEALARVFIVEDLDRNTIEDFGLLLEVEPKFFANHISDAFLDPGTNTGRCPHLPSVSHIKSFYSIDYFHPINLDKRMSDRFCCSSNVRRLVDTFHRVVRRANLVDSALDRVAFVRRKFSFYVQPLEEKKWKVLVLTDPSVLDCRRTHSRHCRATAQHSHRIEVEASYSDPYSEFPDTWPSSLGVATFHKIIDRKGNIGFRSPRGPPEQFNVWSFQGGYVDVLPPEQPRNPDHRNENFSAAWLEKLKSDGRSRRSKKSSPAEDLIYYWTDAAEKSRADRTHHNIPGRVCDPSRESENDISKTRRFLFDISRHALFIAASECMLILQALDASVDARIWDLKNLDLAESAFRGNTTRSLEHYLDDALKLKHLLRGQYKHILHVKDFIESVNKTEPANEVLTRVLPGPFGPPDYSPLQKGSGNDNTSRSTTKDRQVIADYGLGEDFDHITKMIDRHVTICQETIGDIPSLMAVRDSHYAGSLAKLGVIFLPITVVTGIMSIQTEYGLGRPLFWVFWVVSLAVLAITILMTCLPTHPWDRFFEDSMTYYWLGYRKMTRRLQRQRERSVERQA